MFAFLIIKQMGTVIEKFQWDVINLSDNMRPFAYSLTKDMEDAKDLVQETVYKALRYQDKFATGTNVKAWMFIIMKNIFINNYRKKATQNVVKDNSEDQYIINSTSKTVANDGYNRLIMKDINNAIDSLNNDIKTPFLLHYEGFKYHEIAEELALPLGTVKSRIFIARKALKESLSAYA